MAITTALINYRRFLKRRNHSGHTLKHYMNTLKHFILWLDVRLETVDHKKLLAYIDYLFTGGSAENDQLPSGQHPGILSLPHRGGAGADS